jgi:hypothetical protein
MDASERDEAEYLLDTYKIALAMKWQMELFDDEGATAWPLLSSGGGGFFCVVMSV